MTAGELIGCIAVIIWLLGIGGLAHVIPRWLEEDNFIQMLTVMAPERVSILMALVIVSWPVSMPALIIMKAMNEKKERGT